MKNINLAIVGSTGMIGWTFIQILEERNFIVIDNSSSCRMDDDLPLIVLEASSEDISH